MGLAASQARYLTLTSRKNDLEFQSQTINSRRIQLSYKTAEIARAYSEAMNNKKIQICINQEKNIWEALTFSNMLNTDPGYVIIGKDGRPLQPSPYEVTSELTELHHRQGGEYEINGVKIADFSINEEQFNSLNGSPLEALFTTAVEGTTKTYKLKNSITAVEFAALTNATVPTGFPVSVTDLKNCYNSTPEESVTTTLKTNPSYENSNGASIETLLTSGQAQIVTKAFFDFLVREGGYTYANGIVTGGSFEALQQKYQNETDSAPTIFDWRSDETNNFKQKNYTEDDEAAIAEYEAATAEVQAQDKILEMEEKQIETQHKAIETELESVKKVLQKNIDDTFKIFT